MKGSSVKNGNVIVYVRHKCQAKSVTEMLLLIDEKMKGELIELMIAEISEHGFCEKPI